MTKKELSQLCDLNREIDISIAQKEALEDMLQHQRASDTVVGSSAAFPYTQRVFRLEGLPDTKAARRIRQELEETLELIDTQQQQAAAAYKRLIREIGEIDDSLTRQVLMLRFVNGLPWQQVAACIGGGNTADSVRMVAKRYTERKE